MTNMIQPIKVDNNLQSQDENSQKIPEHLFTEIIAPYLECKDLEKYIKTEHRLFQNNPNDQVAFRALFKRDFGIALAQYIKNGKWQDEYNQSIEKLQRLNTLNKALLFRLFITSDEPLQLPFDAKKYISSSSDEAFSDLFQKTAIVGWTSLLSEIIKSERIKNIPSKILKNPIYFSAENGHVEIVKLLIESNLFEGKDLTEAVIMALRSSIQHGRIEIVNLLIKSNKFIENNYCHYMAGLYSVKYCQKNIVELLIEKNFFKKEDLAKAVETRLNLDEKVAFHLKDIAKFLAECRDLFITNFGYDCFDAAIAIVLTKATLTNREREITELLRQ